MNIEDIKNLLRAFDKSKTNILELETDEFKIYLDKTAQVSQQPIPQPQVVQSQPIQQESVQPTIHQEVLAKTEEQDDAELIKSPMVGTFYKAPSPNSAPYVKVGDKVKKGQVLCIIEAMKIMNEIEAEFDCEILEVLVEDGQPVEFDTPLFKVKRI